MTLVIPASRFAAMLDELEEHVEAGAFIELRFDTPEPRLAGEKRAASRRVAGARHPLSGQAEHGLAGAVASSPQTPPPPARAPWLRSEQAYRRRGAWLEWRDQRVWPQWLAAAAWLWLAAHVAWWIVR